MLLFLESPNLLPWSVARAKVDKKPGRSACSGALSLATRTKQENPYLYMVSLTVSQTLICQKQRNMQDIWGAPTGTPDSLQRAVHHLMPPVWSKLIIPASFLAYLTVFFFRLHSLCWCPFGSMSHIVCSHSSLWTELLAQSLYCKHMKMCTFCCVFKYSGARNEIYLQYLNLCILKLLYS